MVVLLVLWRLLVHGCKVRLLLHVLVSVLAVLAVAVRVVRIVHVLDIHTLHPPQVLLLPASNQLRIIAVHLLAAQQLSVAVRLLLVTRILLSTIRVTSILFRYGLHAVIAKRAVSFSLTLTLILGSLVHPHSRHCLHRRSQ